MPINITQLINKTSPEGYTGSRGDVGFQGDIGETGSVGVQGVEGYVGSQGQIGYTGSFAEIGFTGSQGEIGYIGSIGDRGFIGSAASAIVGYTGSRGYTGSNGTSPVDNISPIISNVSQSDPFQYLAYAWGPNTFGQLGDGTTVAKSSPVSVVGGFTDWCYISSADYNNAAIRSNGTLWTWGFNSFGQLGNNSSANSSSPVSVVGGFTDWCSVDVNHGTRSMVGIRSNGTIWTWGYNGQGSLGNLCSTGNQSSPVSVVGGFTDWCSASMGIQHVLALRTNGTLWTWGRGNYGRLGDGTTTNKSSPVSVIGGFTDWCQASAGGYHSLGLRTNGTLWAWGRNSSSQLGDGTTTDRSSPVSVVGGFTDWCQISAGHCHNLALRTNGTLWAWGSNLCGRAGVVDGSNSTSPASVAGGFTDWCQIKAGYRHSAGRRDNGTLWAWGRNTSGQLGDGTTTNRSSPVSVVGGFTDWYKIDTGIAVRQYLPPS
jgi:alpha-tubulin suppressor-like RCC1 family protein